MGTSSDTLIIFDVKGEKKDHLATQEFSLKSLFDGTVNISSNDFMPKLY